MSGIIDLHTHTFFSDGVLSPAETVRRAEHAGYGAIALTDHVDASNLESVLSAMIKFVRETQPFLKIKIIPGVELTHVPPGQVPSLISQCRSFGAQIVLVHGETLTEPVAEGTNRAALEAGVDILAHPGLITEEEVILAKNSGVFLELTARFSHAIANGHVARLAKKLGASMVLNSDFHAPGDYLSTEIRRKVVLGAGLTEADLEIIDRNMISLIQNLKGYRKFI